MPRQNIADLKRTQERKFWPSRARPGLHDQTFEKATGCRSEDARRARLLRLGACRADRLICDGTAKRLGDKLLSKAQGKRVRRSLASSSDMRHLRNAIFSQLARLVHHSAQRVTTFTLIKRGYELKPDELEAVDLSKFLGASLSDLNRRGAAKARGWLIAFVHGEFETPAGIYRLHLHGVAAGEMIDVVDRLRRGPRYKHSRGDSVRFRVRVDRKALRNLPYPLTYCFKSYWPWKHVVLTNRGKRRTRHHRRLPEPYHSQILAFLDRHHPRDFALLVHLEVAKGQLRLRGRQ